MSTSPPGTPPPAGRQVLGILKQRKMWLTPTILLSLLALLLSLLYMGGILTPRANLHDLKVGFVSADQGATINGRHQDLGEQITDAVEKAPDPDDRIDWRPLTPEQAQQQLDSGKLYGVLEVPKDFSASVAQLSVSSDSAPARPTLTVRTNPGLGSMGSSFAQQAAQQAAQKASADLGRTLSQQADSGGQKKMSGAARLMLADPIAVAVEQGHPIGDHSGLGLSAFYYTLLLVLAGFLGANIINNGVDVALGYADNEVGPWHARHRVVAITRTRTLAVKCVMSVVLSLLTSSLIMVATIGILGMDATHLPLLWVFSVCASAAVALGVQAINAAFGGIGQLVSMFAFIVLGLPSSGATIPLSAVPSFYQVLATFEPMRQLSDGVRAILFFDARLDAGLARAWTMTALGTLLALAFGFAMTRFYDRRGLHRLVPADA